MTATTLTIVEISHAEFSRLMEAQPRTRLVLTATAERRDLIDDTGRAIAFSQRVPIRDLRGRQVAALRNSSNDIEHQKKFYAVRTERVRQGLP